MIQGIYNWSKLARKKLKEGFSIAKEKLTKNYTVDWFPYFLCGGLLFVFLLLWITSINDIYLVTISRDTTKSITSVLMEVSGSFIGFLVIYLSISFSNLQNNFGRYALNLFRKDSLLTTVSSLFAVIIIIALSYYLLADSKPFFSNLLFNLTCIAFISAVCLLIPLGNAILTKSSSSDPIRSLIKGLSVNDFTGIPARRWMPDLLIHIAADHSVGRLNVISDILYHNINAGNTKNTSTILINLSLRILDLLKKKDLQENNRLQIHLGYEHILKSAFDHAIIKNDPLAVKLVLAALTSWSEKVEEDNGDNAIEKIDELMEHIGKTLISQENEILTREWLWASYHISNNLLNQIPEETQIWETDASGMITTINSIEAEKKEHLFDAIDKIVVFQFTNTIERVFLSSNYYLIEDCLRQIGTIIEMVIFNDTMGAIQKHRIGSMLTYYFEESIKRFIDRGFIHSKNYMYLYVSNSILIRALEEHTSYSKDIFTVTIRVFDYAIEKDSFTKFDIEHLSGLCRLIIAHSASIPDTAEYVEAILKVQQKLKSKCFTKILAQRVGTAFEKDVASVIQDDFKSYRQTMLRTNINNPALSALLSKYL